MGLAPISVSPRHQKKGIGSALIKTGLQQLFAEGCPFSVVVGDLDYYGRFGFQPAHKLNVFHGFAGLPSDVFGVCYNSQEDLQNVICGRAYYASVFGPQHQEFGST